LLALQLIAVCIGGRTLAILCYCMSKNYKQLSSGAPDLFVIRIKKRKMNITNGNNSSSIPWHEDNEQFEIAPLEYFFGNDWKSHSSNRRSMNQRNNYRSSNNRGQDDLLTAEYNAPNKRKNSYNDNKNSNNRNYQNEGDSMKKTDDKKNFKRLSSVFFKSPTAANKTVQYDTIKQEDDKNNNSKTNQGNNELIDLADDDDSCEEMPPKEQEREPEEQVTVVAGNNEEKEDQHLQNEEQLPSQPKELLQILSEDDLMSDRYYFESSCIEVKGPTDHLAYKQLFWLQVLSLPAIHSTMTAFVGHVREEKQK
jgi:hypothetical protein